MLNYDYLRKISDIERKMGTREIRGTTMADTRLLEQRNGISFLECLQASIQSDLVKEWERLSGQKLLANNPLDRMIDGATGYGMALMGEFANFVYTYVFSTLPEA